MSTQPAKIPRYLRHGPKNKAYVRVRDSEGKRRQIYLPGAHDSPESHRRYREIVAADLLSEPLDQTRRDLEVGKGGSVADLVARFLAWAESYYRRPDGSSTGEFSHFVTAVRPLLKLYRDESSNDFGPRKLKLVRSEMLAQGWSRSHINSQVRRLKQIAKWGVENELGILSIVVDGELITRRPQREFHP